jgi:hypothetical protein
VAYHYKISEALNPNMLNNYRAAIKNANIAQLCANRNIQQLMAKGGSVTYKFEDKTGTKFDTVISSCTAR